MPQLKTKSKTSASTSTLRQPTAADARDLIQKMMEYETAAHERGVSPASGRFEMLTASERQFYRAELIADYIRLSAGNMGGTQGYYDATLSSFCSKICDMSIPSHELIGTYLAAMDIVGKEESLADMTDLADAIRRTMIAVLEGCVAVMTEHSKKAA
ncbi:MAG: hypothetical protein ABFD49_01265 [Armatimonadota bacterium]|nr:hypothetical protein [bacterium]